MKNGNDTAMSKSVEIKFDILRNLTSPEEKTNGIQTYFANVDAFDTLAFGTSENLRTYIAEHNPGRRTKVHRSIEACIKSEPDRFINRNSGLSVVCSSVQVNSDKKKL
jgi:hypothetical protein